MMEKLYPNGKVVYSTLHEAIATETFKDFGNGMFYKMREHTFERMIVDGIEVSYKCCRIIYDDNYHNDKVMVEMAPNEILIIYKELTYGKAVLYNIAE